MWTCNGPSRGTTWFSFSCFHHPSFMFVCLLLLHSHSSWPFTYFLCVCVCDEIFILDHSDDIGALQRVMLTADSDTTCTQGAQVMLNGAMIILECLRGGGEVGG